MCVCVCVCEQAAPPPEPGPAQVEACAGVARLGGVVSCRAFLHSNKPRARQAAQVHSHTHTHTHTSAHTHTHTSAQLHPHTSVCPCQVIKRDVIATVTTRVEMLLEDHLMSEGGDRGNV